MVIGVLYGRTDREESSVAARAIASHYRAQFLEAFGHTNCEELRELAGYGTDEKPCADLVRDAALLLLDVLRDAPRIIEEASKDS
jgi:hypothetical protein